MPKTVLGPEGGYPDAPHVRLAERKGIVTQKVLAIEHPLFGWLKPWNYKFVVAMQGFVQRIDPLELIAFTGLTVFWKGTIEAAQDFGIWFADASKTWNLEFHVDFLGVPGTQAGPFQFNVLGFLIGGVLGGFLLGSLSARETEMVEAQLKTFESEISRWFWALVAAALTLKVGVPLAKLLL